MKYNVLYVSSMCSENIIAKIFRQTNCKPNLAGQKFHRLFAEGMASHNDLFNVSTLSIPPLISKFSSNILFKNKSEIERGVLYKYVPILLIPIIRNVFTAIYVFFNLLCWIVIKPKKNKIIICDILNVFVSSITIFTAFVFRVKTITVVTDLPDMMYILKEKPSYLNLLTARFQNFCLKFSFGYVFLTEPMNTKLNTKYKPYIIIEGFSDENMQNLKPHFKSDDDVKIILYSGGLYEKFGIKVLIEAFSRVEYKNCQLSLYGAGDMDDVIKDFMKRDSRIKFFGYVPNNVVVEAQLNSTILVNPRFSKEEYTKYSFPSKIMEYMASGIPVLTTNLPGIPDEYKQYLYIFRDESVEGFMQSLEELLKTKLFDMYNFGTGAKTFVISNKNNRVQAHKFYDFITSIF